MSEYQEEYIKKYLAGDKSLTGEINLRKTNFDLNENDPNNFDVYNSTFKKTFTSPPAHFKPSELSKEQLNDLRKHHFSLGNDPNTLISEMKEKYEEKEIDPNHNKDQTDKKKFLRKHNHEFGDGHNDYSTMYNETMNKNSSKNPSKMKSKEEIKKDILALRKTNMNIGSDKLDYKTSNAIFLGNTTTTPYYKAPNPNLQQSKIHLGNDDNEYKTTHKEIFKSSANNKVDNELKDQLVKDLRSLINN